MSDTVNAVTTTHAVTRVTSDSTISQTPSPSPDIGREADLARELNDKLSSDIARIRQRLDLTNRPTPDQPDGLGRRLDIRA